MYHQHIQWVATKKNLQNHIIENYSNNVAIYLIHKFWNKWLLRCCKITICYANYKLEKQTEKNIYFIKLPEYLNNIYLI